ncbi:winged helix-turn-helix domain-containing protein [Pandoraea pneumonica]|uniref:winged helix-turn-helix domain-containing protein n=1 Tax=Pandoraea pneumonica TaxID=2508299 RepID=UPI003CFAD74E
MAKYLIGDAARFDSETLTLAATHSPDTPLALGAAAARCLLVLLEADGEIVTKKALLTEAWEQYGAVVSSNNLSQAIVQVRRALEQAGVDPAALATVPRIGYRLHQAVKLSPFVDANTAQSVIPASPAVPIPYFGEEISQIESIAKEISPDTKADDTKVDSHADAEHARTPQDAVAGGQAPLPPRARFSLRPRRAAAIWLGVALISTFAALVVIPPLRGDLRTNARVATWQPVAGNGMQRYFVASDRADDAAYIADRIATLKREPPASATDLDARLVYINSAAHSDTYSYILCRRPIESAVPECVSYLIINQQPERAAS